MTEKTPLLTIAVPTYKRPLKLNRLLHILKKEIESNNLFSEVAIIVSDNSPGNETRDIVAQFPAENLQIHYFKQLNNLGFDGNIHFLYGKSRSEYVWFIGDDDYPLKGSIEKIINQLKISDPDVLLFSFIQPLGSLVRQFNYPEEVHLISHPEEAIKAIISYPKISIYVLRKIPFTFKQEALHQSVIGEGWMFLVLAMSVLESSSNPSVAIFSEQLASCDEDFKYIWVPDPYLFMYRIGQHPYVKKYLPGLEEEMRKEGYVQCIIFSWALKRGKLLVEDKEGLEKFIKQLKWQPIILFKRPKLFLLLLLMKTNMGSIFWKRES